MRPIGWTEADELELQEEHALLQLNLQGTMTILGSLTFSIDDDLYEDTHLAMLKEAETHKE